MKTLKISMVMILLIFSPYSFANATEDVCSLVINQTGKDFYLTDDSNSYHISNGKSSQIFVRPDASTFKLLNGEITVYAGAVQATVSGDFTLMSENEIIPKDMKCSVFYVIHIYP